MHDILICCHAMRSVCKTHTVLAVRLLAINFENALITPLIPTHVRSIRGLSLRVYDTDCRLQDCCV